MVLIIIFIVLFCVMMAAQVPKSAGNRRCWDKGPGESKVHKWVLKDVPGSKQIVLVCRDCGQTPGGE